MADQEPPFIQRYRAWLAPPASLPYAGREAFFKGALIVLDTNVLLSLYEFTPAARAQVAAALSKVTAQLWLPYQVGLEFVRGRHSAIERRASELAKAADDINRKFMEARASILAARQLVQDKLQKHGQDEAARAELEQAISQDAVDEVLQDWRGKLLKHAKELKDAQDVMLGTVDTQDAVLPIVTELYGDRIGTPPSPEVLRHRVEDAAAYRFPNKIPPGFSDIGKGTPLAAAGDYLLWEEVVEHARELAEPRRVLFVSADIAKGDWYEPARPGRGSRPWPMLVDELKARADAAIAFESPQTFFAGIREYLDAEIAEATSEEIARAADAETDRDPPALQVMTEAEAGVTPAPAGLAMAAYHAAGLTTAAVRTAVESPSQRLFQWWLIGVTAQLGLRKADDDEPIVDMPAAVRTAAPPAPYWGKGAVLAQGEWPYRSASWVAPWFTQAVKAAPETDRLILQRLAARQADLPGPRS